MTDSETAPVVSPPCRAHSPCITLRRCSRRRRRPRSASSSFGAGLGRLERSRATQERSGVWCAVGPGGVGPAAQAAPDAYDGFRGLAGAIGDRADGVYDKNSEAEKRVCRTLFGRLVHVSPADTEGADTRRRATRQEIGEAGRQIALKLASQDLRLLVTPK